VHLKKVPASLNQNRKSNAETVIRFTIRSVPQARLSDLPNPASAHPALLGERAIAD
jgi:hypothetical protein